jgi:ABC-type transporter Mla subunit MlaD
MGDLESRVGYLEDHAVMKEGYWLDQEKQNQTLSELRTLLTEGQPAALASSMQLTREVQDKHTKILERHTKTLDQHTKILNRHTEQLDQHTKILNQHTEQLDQHTKILNQHTEQLDQHTRILNRHTEQLDQLTADVAELKTDMTWVKSALGEVLNRLPAKPADPSSN